MLETCLYLVESVSLTHSLSLCLSLPSSPSPSFHQSLSSSLSLSLSVPQEIQQKKDEYERKMAERKARQSSPLATTLASHQSDLVVQNGYCNGLVGNLALFASLAGFVYIVHYMVTNMV